MYMGLDLLRSGSLLLSRNFSRLEKGYQVSIGGMFFEISDTSKLVSEAVPPFFFIIDEVNRAELSRVFGELMYCLEYRGTRGCVKTQYANLNNEHTGMLKDARGICSSFQQTSILLER